MTDPSDNDIEDDPVQLASQVPDRERGFAFFGGRADDDDNPMHLARKVADRDRIGFGEFTIDDEEGC